MTLHTDLPSKLIAYDLPNSFSVVGHTPRRQTRVDSCQHDTVQGGNLVWQFHAMVFMTLVLVT